MTTPSRPQTAGHRPLCGNDPTAQLTDTDRTEVAQFLQHLTEAKNPPKVVCICGSMRFEDLMQAHAQQESLAGRIVVMPHLNTKAWDPAYAEQHKPALDGLHRAKIRLADEILVVGDYVGDSTRAEIAYARYLGKPVRFTHPDVDPGEEG